MTRFHHLFAATWFGNRIASQRPTSIMAFFTSVFLMGLPAWADHITVFAASSMKGALDEAAHSYTELTGDDVTLSYAGSSVLARQISLGAPADVFISANEDWMDVLGSNDRIVEGTRANLVGNALVLIAPTNTAPLTQSDLGDLAGYLSGQRIAMGLVNAVPAGIYGKAALGHLGQWDALAPVVAQTDNVRAALALVALEQTPLGIVYDSDAQADPRVQIVMTFEADSHPMIKYPAAVIKGPNERAGKQFLDWLQQDAAKQIFIQHGFHPLEGS